MQERDLINWTSNGWEIVYIHGDKAQLEKGNWAVVVRKVGGVVSEIKRERT
jgi:hypothetical protein